MHGKKTRKKLILGDSTKRKHKGPYVIYRCEGGGEGGGEEESEDVDCQQVSRKL